MNRLPHFLTAACLAGFAHGEIVINEVHYDAEPATEFVEFIELHNTGASTVDLGGWVFADGVTASIPTGTLLSADDYLLIAEDATALRAKFAGIPSGTTILSYTGSLSNGGEDLELIDEQGDRIDRVDYRAEFPWPISPNGEGDSMQLINGSLDNNLGGAWRGASPTPGVSNRVASTSLPPLVRQVAHEPIAPTSSENTLVTCKVTDDSGVASVEVKYQLVLPGAYIPAYLPLSHSTLTNSPNTPLSPNPAFENPANWTTLTMVDDGTGGDLVAGDDVFTATIPNQGHRTLVRYRIVAMDTEANSVQVPHLDDGSLNFAYFVYDGVPEWTANNSLHPSGGTQTYSPETLNGLETYTMITRDADRKRAFAYSTTGDSGFQIPKGNGGRSVYNWECAFVYDGIVYDHVGYRLRQNNDRYFGVGKRSLRFRFNRGHYFQARDEEGNKVPQKWKRLNSWKMNPFGGLSRFGIDQIINYRLWRMVGVECPRFQSIHFRMIDQASEDPNQFGGDFWGLACFHQNIDNRLIDDLGIPKGNVYKLKDGSTNALDLQRAQARDAVSDGSDFQNIRNNLNPSRSDAWLRDHVDWDQWYRYHAVLEGIRHYDIGATNTHFKNRGWHFAPSEGTPYGLLRVVPHDHNGSWYKGYHDDQNDSGTSIGTDYAWWAIFGDRDRPPAGPEKPAFTLEYRNFVRSFRDLLWQEETVNTLMDDIVADIREFSYADRDRWTGGPAAAGTETTNDIDAIIAPMKEFAFVSDTYLGSNLAGGRGKFFDDLAFDSAIPNTPTISYTGPAEHTNGQLSFQSSSFSDPQGSGTFGAMEWRLAEIDLPNTSIEQPQTIFPYGSDWKYLDDGSNQGVAWRAPLFNDSSWVEGPGQLGYGEGDEATVVGFGPDANFKYPTTYFRRTFNLTNAAELGSVRLSMLIDDGAVVYLNGNQVYSFNMPTTGVNYLSKAAGNSPSDGKTPVETTLPNNFFVEGNNTLAVEVHQQSSASSDLTFDLELKTIPSPPTLPENPKYEWLATWESGPLATFESSISPLALATRTGSTYRARVRHQDTTGRWSHWSDPYEFVATGPDSTFLQESLIFSEVMYHSPDPSPTEIAAGFDTDDEFDYIEIRNLSDSAIDLTNIRLTKGVDFDFAGSAITELAPGEVVLVVENIAAFEMRYGTGLPVAGQWDGRLKNGSELVRLSFGAGTVIKEFTYFDASPWPAMADGDGDSLVLIDPLANPSPDEALNWRSAAATPGLTGTTTFAGGTPAEFQSYVFGELPPAILRLPSGQLEISVSLNIEAEDLVGMLMRSSDLDAWSDAQADYERVALEDLGNGFATLTFRSLVAESESKMFFRYAIESR